MKRRAIVIGLGITLLISPSAVAQQTSKVWKIAYLVSGPSSCPETKPTAAFRQGLRESGFSDSMISLDRRCYASDETARQTAEQLLATKPELVVAAGSPALRAVRHVTHIPVVFGNVADPVGEGFVQSLAHPGTNRTGVADMTYELDAKRMQILKDALPRLRRMATLATEDHPDRPNFRRVTDRVATAIGVDVRHFTVRSAGEIPSAVQAMKKQAVEALLIHQSPLFWAERSRIGALSVSQRLPVLFPNPPAAEEGSLIGYGAELTDLYRRVAGYVAKILKGAKPSDLPVEQPTRFELVINLKTAKSLGLTIPPSLLLRADQVIE